MSKFSKYLDVILIVIGGFVAVYAQADEQQNTYVLISGIVFLMFGLMRLANRIPSKQIEDNFIERLDEEE